MKNKQLLRKNSLLPTPRVYSTITWVYIIICCVFLGYTCSFMFSESIDKITSNRAIIQVTQCIFCLVAIFSGYQIKSNKESISINQEEDLFEKIKDKIPYFNNRNAVVIKGIWDRATKDVEKFRNLIMIIWFSWGLYFFYAALLKPFGNSMFEVPLEVLFNNVTFVAFFGCYVKLNEPKTKVIKEKLVPWITGMLIVFVIHSTILRYKAIDAEIIDSVFLLISGVLNAFAIAVFLGRIESKNIFTPSHYVWIMFIYSALQPLIIISSFGEVDISMTEGVEKISTESMMTIANIRLWLLAIGKGFFFLFTLWLFESKRLIYYFMVTPEVKKSRNQFYEIQNII